MRFEPTQPSPECLPHGATGCLQPAPSSVPATGSAEPPSSLALFLGPLGRLLDDPEVTEICINEPGAAFVERQSGWMREELPFASFDWCMSIAKLVANFTRQRISANEPLLSATLPGGERIQIVLPPATLDRTVSITIRRPSNTLWTLEELRDLRIFEPTRSGPETPAQPSDLESLPPEDRELAGLLVGGDFVAFLRRAVQWRKNILLSGATGSGKTTVGKALILEVPPEDRLITIEDVKELSLRNQPNHVRLFYSQGAQGQAEVTPGQLLAGAKRQRPDRVFVSELRTGEEVYDYLVSVNTGHPGSITSVHADSAEMAFVALAQLMKRSQAGQSMSTRDGVELAQMSVDIVVQCARERRDGLPRRIVREIWYDPGTKIRRLA
ncbi:type IV secretion system protein VirB11 [Variovorax boronicumulans]|uniref:P-type DNA transfer ATPase VirB11 n=1 Tax=Variovorax boronicumulans TaxID=436515 RepID=UPI002784D37F|nr:P-type DNA transfer ATPase VirB11 [Variovorax boronicumulans]MDP9912484.1 type IV secretion system protein VirB11 [Variovorax boronicumulans]